MDTTPVLTVTSGGTQPEPPEAFVDRVAEKMRTLAAVKPAIVRLLEWQIDQDSNLSESRENHDAHHEQREEEDDQGAFDRITRHTSQ